MDSFEDHCWQDVIPADVLEIYAHYKRLITIGPKPALLAIDLYKLAYEGGPRPVVEVIKEFPASCGIHAHEALPPTRALFAAARAAGIPILYSTNDTQPFSSAESGTATQRVGFKPEPGKMEIHPDFAPQQGDIVVYKQRASAFFGTPLVSHLRRLGVETVIIFGESTSGCVRATTVDGYSYGFQMIMAEEACFDRSEISHKLSLFDLHHKYASVIHVPEIVAHLQRLTVERSRSG